MGIFMHVSDEGIFIHREIEFTTSPHPLHQSHALKPQFHKGCNMVFVIKRLSTYRCKRSFMFNWWQNHVCEPVLIVSLPLELAPSPPTGYRKIGHPVTVETEGLSEERKTRGNNNRSIFSPHQRKLGDHACMKRVPGSAPIGLFLIWIFHSFCLWGKFSLSSSWLLTTLCLHAYVYKCACVGLRMG